MVLKIIIYLILVIISSTIAKESKTSLPPGMTPCPVKESNFNECLKKMFNNLMILKDGYKPLDIPPLDPFKVKSLVKFEFKQGALDFRARPKNVVVKGFSKTIAKSARTKITNDTMQIEIDLFLPTLEIQADYKAKGKFNELELKSKGHANVTVSNITLTLIADGTFEMKNGEEYLKVTKVDADPILRGLHFEATGIFPDKELNDMVLELMNQTWKLIVDLIVPQSKPLWKPIALQIYNSIFGKIPIKRIFPS